MLIITLTFNPETQETSFVGNMPLELAQQLIVRHMINTAVQQSKNGQEEKIDGSREEVPEVL